MTKAAKGRWKFMMNNMDNNIAEEQKETKSLAEIMESFGKGICEIMVDCSYFNGSSRFPWILQV